MKRNYLLVAVNLARYYLERLNNYILFRSGSIKSFEYEVRKIFLKKSQSFGRFNQLYQTHPKIELKGQRPTISRFIVYGLENYLTKDMEVLDIGSNVGFFSLYISDKVRNVDMIEINKDLVDICRKVKGKLNIENVQIFNDDFKNHKTDKKYDLIFSFAIHRWVGMTLDSYLNRLSSLLKIKGKLLIESHIIEDRTFPLKSELDQYLNRKENNNFKIMHEGIIDDSQGDLRKFFYLTEND